MFAANEWASEYINSAVTLFDRLRIQRYISECFFVFTYVFSILSHYYIFIVIIIVFYILIVSINVLIQRWIIVVVNK